MKIKEGTTIKIIPILNLKGGTGKTTTARNFGYLLATDYGKRVLLCDLDDSGNLSASFECRPPEGDDMCLSKLLTDKTADPHDYIIKTRTQGVHIIAGNDTLKPADTAIRMDFVNPQQFRLKSQLKKLDGEYDYCLLDCPPSDGIIVINALAAAQEVIIPSNVNQDSLDGIVRVVRLITQVSDFNPSLSLRGVLMTRISNNRVDREGVALELPFPKFRTYIRASVDVERSRFVNQSLREYRGSLPASIDYENFVAEYLGLDPVRRDCPYLQ